MNITYAKKVYLSDERIDKDAVRKRILNSKPPRNLYVIAVCERGNDLLDIIPARELNQPVLNERDYLVVGLAKGYWRALHMAKHIVGDAYAENKDMDIHGFISH